MSSGSFALLHVSRAGPAWTLSERRNEDSVEVRWLGQAGFLLGYRGHSVLIDPYLSDHLASKYAGTQFPHRRMVPPPVTPAQLASVDAVCCTHRHSDHMDPELLPILARRFHHCRFVIPRAEREHALALGLPGPRIIAMDAGESAMLEAAGQIRIEAVPAAHETLRTNEHGEHHCLGFILRFGNRLTIYHSGDCIPYDGLESQLSGRGIDMMLLPVNGRRSELRQHGILGNFSIAEAIALWRETGAQFLIVHHFGMFDFNTVDPAALRQVIRSEGLNGRVFIPEISCAFVLEAEG